MNNGYKIKNGGCGKVMPIQAAHIILITQAVISSVKRTGCDSKSARIQSCVERSHPPNAPITEYDPQFLELYSILRDRH